eukprot:211234-Rhodomonas_salina.1
MQDNGDQDAHGSRSGLRSVNPTPLFLVGVFAKGRQRVGAESGCVCGCVCVAVCSRVAVWLAWLLLRWRRLANEFFSLPPSLPLPLPLHLSFSLLLSHPLSLSLSLFLSLPPSLPPSLRSPSPLPVDETPGENLLSDMGRSLQGWTQPEVSAQSAN